MAPRSVEATPQSAWRPSIRTVVAAALGFCAVTIIAERLDASAVTALAGLALLGLTLLLRPELAILTAIFLIYLNVPAILTQQHGVPAVLAGAVILGFAIPVVRSLVIERQPLRWDPIFLLMLAYLAVLLVASIGARSPAIAIERLQKFVVEGLLLYWLVTNAVRSRATLMRVVRTVLLAGALLGGLTAYQETTGAFSQEFGGLAQRNHEVLALQELDREDPAVRELIQVYVAQRGNRSGRANGPTDEPNRFAQILVVLLPLALLSYRASRSRVGRMSALTAGVLILGGVVFSDSRGAFATLAGLVLLAAYTGWIRPRHVLIAALAALPLMPIVAPRYVQRVASLNAAIGNDGSEGADGAIRSRATAMLAAAHVFVDHPLLGVGPGQYKSNYAYAYEQRYSRFGYTPEPLGTYAHSLYLELAAESGIAGLVVFLSIFVVLLRRLAAARQRWKGSRPDLAELATAFAFVLLAYLGTAAFLHLMIQRYLWLLTAMASVALDLVHPDRSGMDPGARMTYRERYAS